MAKGGRGDDVFAPTVRQDRMGSFRQFNLGRSKEAEGLEVTLHGWPPDRQGQLGGADIGGMNEVELKKSEKKQIVISSYVMCSEGLDIPTLNAEFLITPKTDIVQTVGRILRAKHKFSHPIIYDFVDSHDVFQRQWLKRKSYYKKQLISN